MTSPDVETRMVLAVQRGTLTPASLRLARTLSLAGEHAGAWIALGALAAAIDRPRRIDWAGAAMTVVAAHAASVVIKRVARRVRPAHPGLVAHVAVPSRWSFPSSHMASTTAAALVYGRLLGSPLPGALVPAMAWSRLALGVHYPTDVAAGAALGTAVVSTVEAGRASRRAVPRT